jgi:hypothetical protein
VTCGVAGGVGRSVTLVDGHRFGTRAGGGGGVGMRSVRLPSNKPLQSPCSSTVSRISFDVRLLQLRRCCWPKAKRSIGRPRKRWKDRLHLEG